MLFGQSMQACECGTQAALSSVHDAKGNMISVTNIFDSPVV